jgi:septum formation protein
MKLILASSSPRRAELLSQAGIQFIIEEPAVAEEMEVNLPPGELVLRLAEKKALAVSRRVEEGLILAADTVVVLGGVILGKPSDRQDARVMLSLLSGRQHEVLTGMILADAHSGRTETGVSATKVWMEKLSSEEIDSYIATGEPFDKAGAYAIQGRAALYIKKIEGCYTNVVGLPLNLLYELMKKMQH